MSTYGMKPSFIHLEVNDLLMASCSRARSSCSCFPAKGGLRQIYEGRFIPYVDKRVGYWVKKRNYHVSSDPSPAKERVPIWPRKCPGSTCIEMMNPSLAK
eukprot:TRINITY_DN279_c0_g1_i6.p1 TRINITY_DN279_c0_g1~~TRINITY_DN279_c0_g1_i6.p1  ORF type:complete len:100 (+),score=4.51 TRINITY_DN279_c0_g1_i6:587-886(+)